jgi:alpha-glucosidase
MSIPCTINMGLSGIAFNGPDVGGFFGNTDEELITRWYQAGFLFPFLRNHSTNHTKEQEPWNFGPDCLRRIRATIQTRYRLLPHLYNCFFAHHLTGDPILRPLLYEFDDRAFENTDDQFLIGDSLMVAPIVESAAAGRSVVDRGKRRQERWIRLPEGWWFDLMAGEWIAGGQTIHVGACLDEVPLFVRDGSVIPYFPGKLSNGFLSKREVELHIFSREKTARLDYYIDDRETRRYLEGAYNVARIEAAIAKGEATVRIAESGPLPRGSVKLSPVFYGSAPARVSIERDRVMKRRALRPGTRDWVGRQVPVRA